MSHSHGGSSDYGPSTARKAIASLVAGLIIGVGRLIYAIFHGVFNLLSSIV